MTKLQLRDLRKDFGAVPIIKGIDLAIEEGEFVVFVGPSGCGKSTLLRIVAGLEQPSAGEVVLEGEVVNDHTPFERRVAMVFQSYALYPHMSVADNIAFPLRMANEAPETIRRKVKEAAAVLQIDHLLDRKPAQLSGGQKQRVAMGRTIVRDPALFLFDEPLSNLDADLRIEMRVEIERLHKRLGATMIYVTHDQVEAMTLADRIVVLRDGLVEQVGPPIELYERPANLFVASFLGAPKINLVAATCLAIGDRETRIALADDVARTVPFPVVGVAPGDRLTLGIRPENLSVGTGDLAIPFELEIQERLGSTSFLHGTCLGERVVAEHRRRGSVGPEEATSLAAEADQVHLFRADGTSARLPREGAR